MTSFYKDITPCCGVHSYFLYAHTDTYSNDLETCANTSSIVFSPALFCGQEDRQHGVVLHALEAVSYVMQDMLQVKYGARAALEVGLSELLKSTSTPGACF